MTSVNGPLFTASKIGLSPGTTFQLVSFHVKPRDDLYVKMSQAACATHDGNRMRACVASETSQIEGFPYPCWPWVPLIRTSSPPSRPSWTTWEHWAPAMPPKTEPDNHRRVACCGDTNSTLGDAIFVGVGVCLTFSVLISFFLARKAEAVRSGRRLD